MQSYAPNASYPDWIYNIWFVVNVKASVFGTLVLGRPVIASLHATPYKTGSITEWVKDTICTYWFPSLAPGPDSDSNFYLIVYPYPFNENITIDFNTSLEGNATIVITDVAGRVVESFNHASGSVITGENLSPGIYFISLTQNGLRKVIKIVKQSW